MATSINLKSLITLDTSRVQSSREFICQIVYRPFHKM